MEKRLNFRKKQPKYGKVSEQDICKNNKQEKMQKKVAKNKKKTCLKKR
ncbi:MAG: hypothetical protein QME12_04695 [Nanoarchaeota archaeon]|nr:hypothetical protein [Nanoarchaeota archaeon]